MILKLFIMSLSAFAGEPDNFSARLDTNSHVANAFINETVDNILSLAVYEANGRKKGCDKTLMINLLKDELDRNFPKITTYLYRNVPFAGPDAYTKVPYQGTIPYGRTTFTPSTKVQIKGETFYIGIDKLDHFFSHGFLYWNIVNDPKLPADKIKNALDLGVAQEEGPWGLQFTGVKSYADMSANFKGMTFWRDLFDGNPAFIGCEDNKFVIKKQFQLESYFDSSMDESINCNSYAKPEMLQAIKSFTDKNKVSCPVSPEACAQFVKNYPANVAEKILHPLCRKTGTSQIEKASKLSSRDIIDGVQGLFSGGGNLFEVLFPSAKKPTPTNGGVISK